MLGRFTLYENNLEKKLDAWDVSAYSLSHRAAERSTAKQKRKHHDYYQENERTGKRRLS